MTAVGQLVVGLGLGWALVVGLRGAGAPPSAYAAIVGLLVLVALAALARRAGLPLGVAVLVAVGAASAAGLVFAWTVAGPWFVGVLAGTVGTVPWPAWVAVGVVAAFCLINSRGAPRGVHRRR